MAIKIKPHKTEEYEVAQSKHPFVGKLPTRALLLGPSGSGKTILLQNLILDIYRNCFSRIFIFSASINVDPVWLPVKKYIANEIGQDERKEPCFFEHYHESQMESIIENQHKLIQHMKANKMKKLFQILVVLDDVADDKQLCRNSRMLNSLYVRGRHDAISVISSVQFYHALQPCIRINATQLYVFKLRNQKDLESVVEALSALVNKETIMQLYKVATADPHSFWYIDLVAKDPDKMFYKNFDSRLVVRENESEAHDPGASKAHEIISR